MRFAERIFSIGRVGQFIEVSPRWGDFSMTTPMCLTYTRSGSVPHLTQDVLKHLDIDPRGSTFALHPLPTVLDFVKAVEVMGCGLGRFVGASEIQPIHISVQDPATETPSGYNVKKGASVWTFGGKRVLSPKDFMDVQKTFRPFSYQALCDSDTPPDASRKRLSKSVENSLNFLDRCLEYHREYDELKDTLIFGTLQGGYDQLMRAKSAEETLKRDVDGFIIDGFTANGPDVRQIDFNKIEPLLNSIISLLPSHKPRMLNGPFRPSAILSAIKCGIDMFDSSYPYVLTENGEALNLTPQLAEFKTDRHSLSKSSKHTTELDLKEKFYADKFEPISKDCHCYSCKNFTQSYVHHLIVTSELLGKVLLMLHNMHQFQEFFITIRKSIEEETFSNLEALLCL